MVSIGNFVFRNRNFLFPILYLMLFLPLPRMSANYILVFVIGLGIALTGQLLRMLTIGLVYIVRGGKNRRIYADGLVTEGLFAHCRNPMYLGNIMIITGLAVMSNSLLAVALLVPLFILIYWSIIRAEEEFLLNKFSDDYKLYCEKTPRWFPLLKGLKLTLISSEFNIKRVVYKEYNATFIWLMGALGLLALNSFWFDEASFWQEYKSILLIVAGSLVVLYAIVRFLKKKEQQKQKIKISDQADKGRTKSALMIITLVLFNSLLTAQTADDSAPRKNNFFKENKILKESIVPASLLLAGILISDSDFEQDLQVNLRNQVGNDFYTTIDDHTRNIPIAEMYIADIAGVKARNHWFDQTKNLLISVLLTDLLTMQLKYATGKQRPDGDDDYESWPSGHTSHAFATATVLYEEFRDTSPILAYSGYLFAATTGFLRMANNRHYLSDVLAGAGIGILVTKFVYRYDYLIPWNPFLEKNNMALLPRYSEGTVGLYFVKKF